MLGLTIGVSSRAKPSKGGARLLGGGVHNAAYNARWWQGETPPQAAVSDTSAMVHAEQGGRGQGGARGGANVEQACSRIIRAGR